MYFRNGEALGSVLLEAVPSAEAPKRSHHKKEPEVDPELVVEEEKTEEKSQVVKSPAAKSPVVHEPVGSQDVIDIMKLKGKKDPSA